MIQFILDQSAVEEYRADRMAEAAAYNSVVRSKNNSLKVSFYNTLEKLGALLENWGVKIQNRYNCLAVQEKREMLANSAK